MKPQESRLSPYHYGVLGVYAVFLLVLTQVAPLVFQYSFVSHHIYVLLVATAVTLVTFYLLNSFFKLAELKFQKVNIVGVLGIAIAFAVPEEIIFRGIIQGNLSLYLESSVLVVLLSSLIFGLVHLPNGATGMQPVAWNWKFAIVAFLGGIPLSIGFTLTGSLLVPTILHGLFLVILQLFVENPRR